METNSVKTNCHKENELRKVFNLESNRVKSILRDYVGKKGVKTTTNQLIKKIGIEFDAQLIKIEPLTKGGFASCHCLYLKIGYSTIYLSVSLCFNGGSYDDNSYYCIYHKDEYYIADYDRENGNINRVAEDFTHPMLDEKAEIENHNKAIETKKELDRLNGLLYRENRVN